MSMDVNGKRLRIGPATDLKNPEPIPHPKSKHVHSMNSVEMVIGSKLINPDSGRSNMLLVPLSHLRTKWTCFPVAGCEL